MLFVYWLNLLRAEKSHWCLNDILAGFVEDVGYCGDVAAVSGDDLGWVDHCAFAEMNFSGVCFVDLYFLTGFEVVHFLLFHWFEMYLRTMAESAPTVRQ